MKKILVMITVLMMASMLLPMVALAATDDFEVTYEFNPDLVGSSGADVQLLLTVENTGSTNITWVDVVINTNTAYTQRWVGTITPDSSRTISYLIPFTLHDVNEEKILQVSMNNNSTTNPDGVQMFRFQIDATSDIFNETWTISPNRETYYPGETVIITHYFENNFEANTAMDVNTFIYMTISGVRHIYDSPDVEHGNVFPRAQATHSFGYTFDEDDIGDIIVGYTLSFDMMGHHYNFGEASLRFTVESLEPDIDFNATLTASPTTIDAGDMVTFNVNLENTGDDTIDTFEIRNSEGGIISTTESIRSGDSGSVPISISIHETTDVSYTVVARTGGYSESVETNIVSITVRAPTTHTPTPTLTPTSDPEEETMSEPTIEPTIELDEDIVTTSPPPQVVVDETEQEAVILDTNDEIIDGNINTSLLWIIIIVLISVIAVLIIGLIIYVVKSKSNKK